MRFPISLALLFFIQLRYVVALDFTIAGGQIFTPGFAVLDAPQPGTPLGGGKFIRHGNPVSRTYLLAIAA